MSFKFIAGLAIGAAIVHFFSTQEGRAFVSRFKSDINSVEDGITSLAENAIQKGKNLINGTKEEQEIPLIVVIESNPVV